MTPTAIEPRPNRGAILRKQRWVTLAFALVVLIPSGLGFSKKLHELILLTRGDVDGVFAITPVVNYLLTSLGFFFLFCWATLNGMFGDIERPKRHMLEVERMLDEEDSSYPPFEDDR
jgi:hypothetical protein